MSTPLVRPEFVRQMEHELQSNQHKGDWNQWHPSTLEVLSEIQHHEAKLMQALAKGDSPLIREYTADLANLAMKLDEQFGGPPAPPDLTTENVGGCELMAGCRYVCLFKRPLLSDPCSKCPRRP